MTRPGLRAHIFAVPNHRPGQNTHWTWTALVPTIGFTTCPTWDEALTAARTLLRLAQRSTWTQPHLPRRIPGATLPDWPDPPPTMAVAIPAAPGDLPPVPPEWRDLPAAMLEPGGFSLRFDEDDTEAWPGPATEPPNTSAPWLSGQPSSAPAAPTAMNASASGATAPSQSAHPAQAGTWPTTAPPEPSSDPVTSDAIDTKAPYGATGPDEGDPVNHPSPEWR